MLFNLAEIKSTNLTREFSKVLLPTNQKRAFIIWKFFIFSDINQSESSFKGHGIFNKIYVNQSKMSSTSHGFFNNFDIVCGYQGFLHR